MASKKKPGTWKPGGRGRPPKNADEIRAERQRAGLKWVSEIPDVPAPGAAAEDIDDEIDDDEPAAPKGEHAPPPPANGPIANPLHSTPAPKDNVIQFPGSTGDAPGAVAPWDDPKRYAPLIVPCTFGLSFALDFACRKYQREPIAQEKFHRSGVAKQAAQTLVAFYPELAEMDPRYMLLGTLATTCIALVTSQPEIGQAAPVLEPQPPPAPAGPRSDDNVRPIRPNIDAAEVEHAPQGPDPDEAS